PSIAWCSRPRSRTASPDGARPQRPFHVALRLAFRDVATLVPKLLPARERELDLRATVTKVELRRDEREPALADLAGQRVQLLAVEHELAVSVGIVVLPVPLLVHRDVRSDEPGLPVSHLRIGLLQRRSALAEGLHLRAGEDEPGLHAVEQLVLVPRAAVVH